MQNKCGDGMKKYQLIPLLLIFMFPSFIWSYPWPMEKVLNDKNFGDPLPVVSTLGDYITKTVLVTAFSEEKLHKYTLSMIRHGGGAEQALPLQFMIDSCWSLSRCPSGQE